MNVLEWALLLAFGILTGCQGDTTPEHFDVDLGPIDRTIDPIVATVWPGVETETGRHVRRVNGFHDGEPTTYWFAGFASRLAADVFWFCEEGDTACPFDDSGVIDRSRTIGNPVFARIPGELDYSPFWVSWVVRVPKSYKANDLKSMKGIEDAEKAGFLTVEPSMFDHGGDVGPDIALMHCLLVLEDTELEGNGDLIPTYDGQGDPSMYLPPRQGWHKQYQVKYFEFNDSAGVFPPDPASESVPLFPHADIFVYFRDCANGSQSTSCGSTSAEMGAVSERGVELDLTSDGDKADNNNIISAMPRTPVVNPEFDKAYSPLWRVHRVLIPVENDSEMVLMDSTVDQNDTIARSTADVRALYEQGLTLEPEPLTEEFAGNQIYGNDGMLFFNCPSQVVE